MMQTAAPASDLRTREETARLLRISTVTLDIWTKAQTGPAPTRLGGRVFFREVEIERFLNDRTEKATEQMAPGEADSIAAIVESELAQRTDFESPFRQEVLKAIADLAQAIRLMDIGIREGVYAPRHARQFVASTDRLITHLHKIGGTAKIAESLAEDIAIGALQTAHDLFPELLPDDLRPPQ